MKRIFKAIFAIAAGITLLASCQQAGDVLALSLSADQTVINFDGAAPQEVTVNLSADGDWYAYAPDWITISPSHGTGNAAVKVIASKNLDEWNELNAPRADVVAFCGAGDKRFSVNVSQMGEAGLDDTKYYKQIKSAAEVDPDVTFLIIFNLGGDLQAAMNIGCEKDNSSSYAYGYTTGVTPDENGTVIMTNGSLSHKLVPVEDGYAIRQPNGAYIYQSASYANFYLTTDISKASTWTLSFNDKGEAVLTNISAGDRILQYDNAQYKDFGAWPTVASGYVLPTLYMDQAEPTGEELFPVEETFVLASANSAVIPVVSNRKWTVRNHDSWIKDFTPSGNGNGNIQVTLDSNNGASRIAEFLVIGETTNTTVKLIQAAPIKSVADLNAWCELTGTSADYDAQLTNAVVSYVNGNNAFIDDGKAGILLYKSGHGLKVGDAFTGKISGKGTMYGGAPELTSWNDSEAVKSTGEPVILTVTLADLIKDFPKYVSRVVKLEGVKFTDGLGKGDRNGKLSQGSSSIDLYAKVNNQVIITTNSEGDLIAIPCYNNGKKQLGIWANKDFTATKIGGAITVPATLEVENGGTAALGATTNSGAAITYKSSDETVATVSADGTVTGLKTGEATITLTAPAEGDYTAAEATCQVSVVAPAPKVTIVADVIPTAYGNDTEFVANGKTFKATQVGSFGNGIQFKKSVNAYIYNAEALGSKITEIVISRDSDTFHPENFEIKVGSSEQPDTVVEGKVSGNTQTFDLSSGNYTYFKITNTSTYTGYLDSIVIKYAE